MSSEWKDVSLDDIADLNGGYAFKSEEYTEVGHFVLRTVNISDDGRICQDGAAYVSPASAKKYERFLLKDLDTLFVMVGATLGKTGLVKAGDLPALLNQNMWVVRAKTDQVDPLFLHYAFRVISRPMCSLASGSARSFVKRDDFRQMRVRVPEIRVQRRISDLLGALDDRITLLRETNTTLEAIAQALFKSWFVDFDPVHAKMQGRVPEGMDEATAALFPDSFEKSGLVTVPNGWSSVSFRESIDVIGGGTPKTSATEYWGGEIPWFSVVDAPSASDVFVVNTEKHITVAGLNGSSTKLLPTGTTIISARGTVGRLALTGCPMAMNQSCYGLRGKAGDQYFTYFGTTRLVEQLKQRAHGSVFDTITQETFGGVSICYPTIVVIQAFEQIVEPLLMRIRENLIQANSLATVRDCLLPRLISGQLRTPETQAIMESVV